MHTDPDTRIGGAAGRFPSTVQSLVDEVRGGDRRRSLQRLIDLYWKPVYCLVRHSWAKTNEDAKDLTQDFFADEVLQGRLLDRFSPERGSFRAYLRASVTNFLRHANRDAKALKRGGGTRMIPLEELALGDVVPDAQALPPEEVFDSAWKQVLLDRAMDRMECRLEAEGKGAVLEVFRRYELDPGHADRSYREIGEALGLGADTVKNHLTRARQEYKKAVSDVICEYVDSPEDLSRELRELFGI